MRYVDLAEVIDTPNLLIGISCGHTKITNATSFISRSSVRCFACGGVDRGSKLHQVVVMALVPNAHKTRQWWRTIQAVCSISCAKALVAYVNMNSQ